MFFFVFFYFCIPSHVPYYFIYKSLVFVLFRVYICQSFDLCIDMLLQSVDIMIKAML